MIKTEKIGISGVELDPIRQVCSLCGKNSKHKVIWTENPNSALGKCLRVGYSYTDYDGRSVHFADYEKKNLVLGHIFIENGGKEFLGVICTACNTLYRPLLHQQMNIQAIEAWGIYYRTKNGALGSYIGRFDAKMATAVACNKCKGETSSFYIKVLHGKAHNLCYHAPNMCHP